MAENCLVSLPARSQSNIHDAAAAAEDKPRRTNVCLLMTPYVTGAVSLTRFWLKQASHGMAESCPVSLPGRSQSYKHDAAAVAT
jgi:hypothetical protein